MPRENGFTDISCTEHFAKQGLKEEVQRKPLDLGTALNGLRPRPWNAHWLRYSGAGARRSVHGLVGTVHYKLRGTEDS